MKRAPKWTARRAFAALQAELMARRREAGAILRQEWVKRQMRPGYVSKDTREMVEGLIAELES